MLDSINIIQCWLASTDCSKDWLSKSYVLGKMLSNFLTEQSALCKQKSYIEL